MATLNFYGGVGTATGANIMLTTGGKKIVIDCGLLQGLRNQEDTNYDNFAYNPAECDVLLVTHAHMDHIGKIPKLVRDGFKGRIISTKITQEIARPMLEDALRVQQYRNPGKTLFTEANIAEAFNLWEGREYHEKIELFPDVTVEMKDAGHILGSAIMLVSAEGKKYAFTGDLGNSPSPLLPDTEFIKDANYLVMESVYGDRNHENRDERKEKLKAAILGGIKRGGAIVIPAFSIERTQVLLYEINNMVEDGEIPSIPVYIDSPLASKVTEVYKEHVDKFKEEVREEIKSGDDIFNFPKLKIVRTHDESGRVEDMPNPKMIIAGSGMSQGGRVVNHELHLLPGKENTVILVGYQAVATLGRHLQEGLAEVLIPVGHGTQKEKVRVNAKIENITGYSSHRDSDGLLEFVAEAGEQGKLKKVFCIMGEPKSSLFLVQKIRDNLDIEAIYPEPKTPYEV